MGVTPISVPQGIAQVIDRAGSRNGVDFDYLLQTAIRESSLDPSAKARTSSATGLFQFLEGTWLQVMKTEGPRLGYAKEAAAISVDREGNYIVADPARRREILDLRKDPAIASDLAAAFTKSNGDYLLDRFGRMPSPGELYIAHFLGARGAATFFEAGLSNPDQSAPALFPRQAEANRSIFYAGGKPRSIRQVYEVLVAKHRPDDAVGAGAPSPTFVAQQMAGPVARAMAVPPPAPDLIPSRFGPDDLSFTALFSTEPATAPRPLVVPVTSSTPHTNPHEPAQLFSRFYVQPQPDEGKSSP
ncbi:hypothetical protein SAMN02983003_0266 [Devosia enhydra]|uniref:Transglycosylase SLT domain-containing protein n=1 Tax=Devosia enhydra TaxID=665118 RepID=A0A1K2HT36_9HYPH|nr:hypothetical protein [Devosia enhydra]SFZ81018.1 hypothetical protein SAMN02983003_0266 [Devosia enhydra]